MHANSHLYVQSNDLVSSESREFVFSLTSDGSPLKDKILSDCDVDKREFRVKRK